MRVPFDHAADLGAVAGRDLGGDDAGGCEDDLRDRARGGACVHEVTGRLVDENGGGIEGATITVCANGCFYGMTGAGGHFTVTIGMYLVVAEYSVLAHVNPRRAAYYAPLPAPSG